MSELLGGVWVVGCGRRSGKKTAGKGTEHRVCSAIAILKIDYVVRS